MSSSTAYLFLELAIVVYFVGFGWHYWRAATLRSRASLFAAAALAALWFVLDQIALHFNLWTFPEGGSMPIRLLSLPVEEYLLFFIHTFVCLILIQRYAKG